MADMEKLRTYTVTCEGGLDSNKNHIALAQEAPGAAIRLVNYEPSLYGGYRKLDGFQPLEPEYAEVDPTGAEGRILLVHVFDKTVITARKQSGGNTYNYYYWSSGADWTQYTTGLTLNSTNVTRIRATSYNLQGPESVICVDGVNPAVLFNGTDWAQISSIGSGVDFENAGGNQAVDAPKYVSSFKNHLFIAGDPSHPQIVAHSAPNTDYDWTVANGAGQVNVGFAVKQIRPFRDALYVFGDTRIKKIVVDQTTFVVEDVTNNIGLLAQDSVVEINGDLVFLSPDGIRPIAGTEKNFDVELGVISKRIQQDVTEMINTADLNEVSAVVIRRKSQVRFFFSDENLSTRLNSGILGGLKGNPSEAFWEWGSIRGIRASCVASGYIENQEYVVHGDFNGVVYRQETGNSFDGETIPTVYATPYLDFGDVFIRKTLHKVIFFIRPEGDVELSARFSYDWGGADVHNPTPYLIEGKSQGSLYNQSYWNQAFYASVPEPFLVKNVEGSFFSSNVSLSSDDDFGSYSIQAIAYEYVVDGRR